jgi:hypothetical protein
VALLALAVTLALSVPTQAQAADAPAAAAAPPRLDPHLEPLRPLLEKTWKGTFKNSKPDKPTVDVMRWERALNGKAVRILHSINDGSYGGETLVIWDEAKKTLTTHYFTTAGFTTTGTITFEEKKILTHEVTKGSSVNEVRATSEFKDDGTFHVKSEHLRNGQWEPGHEVVYREEPNARVLFR